MTSLIPPGGVMGIEASGFGNVAIHAIGGLKAEGFSAGPASAFWRRELWGSKEQGYALWS